MTRLEELPYPIVIDRDIARAVAAFGRERGATGSAVRAQRAPTIVLADRNVAARASLVARALGTKTKLCTFALGERRKTLPTLGTVLDALAAAGADRTTTIVGVGGGVALDLFGFAAASYMRGVAFVAVATSLVAMVDAAVGGKTGVNLTAGKNLAGSFSDPRAVFCDVGALATLPERAVREGLAEIVKHGIIEGGETFEALETLAPHPLGKWPWETVIADSLRVKTMYVREDRTERGAREVLNLGHTFAHAIEAASGYRTPHGAAVAIGLRAAGLLGLRKGWLSGADHLRILTLLTLLRLPLATASVDIDALVRAMLHDKKSRSGELRFVVPRAIGDVEYGVRAHISTVRDVLASLAVHPEAMEITRLNAARPRLAVGPLRRTPMRRGGRR